VIKSSKDLGAITKFLQKKLNQNLDPSNIPNQYKNLNGLYTYWTSDELSELMHTKDGNLSKIITDYSINAYGYFCYSTKVWDEFNDRIAKLRKGTRILRGGLQLATNNMPQGDLITIPLTSNIGYQNQAHVIIHFRNADPDLGRKGFQPELRQTAEEISVSIVNNLKKWRKLLKKDSGAKPAIFDEGEVYDWIKKQENYEKKHPLVIKNKNFFIPINEISITSKPNSEQDTVVLFNQLIAGGVIRGIKLLATSTHQQYDGIFRFYVNEPFEHHTFDKTKNPLGVEELQYDREYLSKPYILEYKFNIDALIQEFENGEKNENDIKLVIAWEMGNEWKKRYSINSLLDLSSLQHRPFHGLTHIFYDDTTGQERFFAIILSELIEYLDDVEKCQTIQKEKYGDIL
jgi:hypothetical protein